MLSKWDVRFLKLAEFYASFSKDPSTKVGAVIIDPKTHIELGSGYNGFPRGVCDYPERYADRETKYKFVVHAEVNACINTNGNGNLKGGTLYIYPTLSIPAVCSECAKIVIQCGIKRVVFWDTPVSDRWQASAEISRIMFTEAGVKMSAIPFQKSTT